jgi:integrase
MNIAAPADTAVPFSSATVYDGCNGLAIPSAEIRYYLENSLSYNTRIAYRSDLEHFNMWGGKIPASPETIASYLTNHATILCIATLQRRLISISKAHSMGNYPDPVKSDLVKLAMKGIRRLHGRPQAQVAPILREDLIIMLSHIPDTIKGKRDRALLMLGLCAALRRSELVAVKIEDIEFTSQGIVLTLPRSKTDQVGSGRKIGIPKGRGRICPVQAVSDWLLLHSSANNSALFKSIKKGGTISEAALSDRAVADIIKYYAGKAGLNARRYSGHSLRAGLATSAAQNGIPSWKIKEQTGHRSDAMLSRYIRGGNLFEGNAAALF